MKKTSFHYWVALLVSVLVSIGSAQAAEWHVDDDNCPGPGDGSVCNPFCRIQVAIDAAISGDVILIHDGVYPEAGINLGSKELLLQSLNGPGSVLLTGADPGGPIMRIQGGQTAATMILGLTFTNTTENVRAMNIAFASPTVQNCIFENTTHGGGGTVTVGGSNAIFNDCIFRNNTAIGSPQSDAGAVHIGSPNTGILTEPQFNCCTFEDNWAERSGGAVKIQNGEGTVNATFHGCMFRRNTSPGAAGGQHIGGLSVNIVQGGSSFFDCTFRDHTLGWTSGNGAVKIQNGAYKTLFERCVFENNHTSANRHTNSLFIAMTGGFGGPSGVGSVVDIVKCRFENNTGNGSTIFATAEASVKIIDSQFINNTSTHSPVVNFEVSTTSHKSFFYNCLFHGNTTSSWRTPPVNATGVSLSNCLFVDNHSTDPEAPSALGMRHAIVSSCTFYNNTSPNGHAVEYYGSGANFLNSIVWGSGMALSSLPVWNSVVDGGYSWGTNVIADDPMFVDPDGPDNDLSTWQDNDFSLRTGSPCIDSGHSDLIFLDLHDLDGDGDTVEQIPFDFVGNARRIDDPNRLDCEAFGAGNCGTAPLPDMGAFEGPPGAPLIIDQTTGGGCAPFVSTDADGDGVPDAADACDGFNDCLDADSDGTPDGCDACPNDPNKSEVGICGCGISDADSDEDSTPDCADGCPNDASKTHPGACGCGVSDTDIDNDGTADCNDVCLSDPNKTEAGQCGCGVADTDSDFDGVPDCNDGCPNDNAKTAPGVCGCGALETDLDADGTPNCNDHCPADPAKTEPGQCGCAVLETDTDNDGTADCNDNCPSDPYKTQPGQCGCSVVDTDTDSDGTSDCNDGCPIDPGKTAPGECGCSQVDSDADSDGTADCNDGCPSDPNKTEPGQCNCGTIDVDSDADGTADCNDGCPTDHGKTSPGVCGCGVPDIDSDLDGVLDCVDPCPNDPDTDGDGVDNCEDVCPLDVNKIDAGQCGCGNADTDSDSDGVADCLDGCPIDVSKIAPSQCGCGNPDTDTDGDGLANCNDGCPLDVNKIEPGICGCGVSDTDSDLDGTANCIDNCPSDPNKSDSGQCGCGIADTDTDIDGTADCNDGCPNDPNKIAVGTCGCGILDTDSDGDGEADCNDNCSADPNKTNPGPCGCGHADTDADGDGTADCIDGCPSDASKTAAGSCGCGLPETDGDGDGVADCVDNCPATVNPNQVDADNDGLGDVCDNQPPTAVTGPDQTINEGVLVSLDGGLSSDPDNDTISYLWTQLAGPAVALDTSDPIHPTFTAPTVPVGGATLTFQLVVSDGQFSSEPAAVNVVVKNVNHAPVALAGVDQTVGEAAPVVLSGADSYDADTDALTYTWTQIVGPVVTLSNAGTVEASFSAPLVGSGGETLAFSLTVSDGLAQSVDSVIVFVENVNHAPTANAGEDQTRDEGTVVALDGSASHDPDNDALSYSWVQTAGPAVALTGASTATPVFAAPTVALTQNETLSFVLTVDDGLGGTAADEVVITVLDTNAPPACELAEPSKPMLWPPNHKLIPFAITGASDPEAGDVSITIIAVTQDEPLNGLGDGDTAPDAVLQDGTVLLRAERAGVGNGRVYHIHFAANDGEGGTCVGVVTTCVPHDMGKGSSCIDDGQSYNSLAP